METKEITIPFDLERAKRITNKGEEGKIVTRNGDKVRILSFDRKDEFRPIVALIHNGAMEAVYTLSSQGKTSMNDEINKNDLMLSVPEYTTFKDGDVIVYDECILLFSGNVNQYDLCGCHCSLFADTKSLDLNFDYKGVFPETRYATSGEKQKLIDALKASDHPLAKEYLKRFFDIEDKKEYKFEPKQWVLCKGSYNPTWTLCQFSHIEEGIVAKYVTVGGNYWVDCIPYNDQTKHLLGTTNNL